MKKKPSLSQLVRRYKTLSEYARIARADARRWEKVARETLEAMPVRVR
jgi:hypothetical protein